MKHIASRLVVGSLAIGTPFVMIAGCQQEIQRSQSSVASGEMSGCDRGSKEAAASISAGQLLLKEYPPLPSPPGHSEYIKLLRDRCGVEYKVISKVPDGVDRDDFAAEIKCWNETMEAEIRRQHGNAIFDELHDAANKSWRARINAGS